MTKIPTNMAPYFQLMEDLYRNSSVITNARTGEKCWYQSGTHLEFNMDEGFPANTRKLVGIKGPVGELLGLLRGYTNAADFERVGTKVWYGNANETPAWLSNPWRKGENDNGMIYGFRDWVDTCVAKSEAERDLYLQQGYAVDVEGKDGKFAMTRVIKQLDKLLHTLLTNPTDRRMIVTALNVGSFDKCSLPPCHHTYTFTYFPDGRLDVECSMRSWDMAKAYNVQLSALFLHIVCRLVGMKPGRVILNCSNTHLYESGIEGVEIMLGRTDYTAPQLVLSDNIKQVDLSNYQGAFERIEPSDIWLEGYESHPAIKTKMVV
ncbi:MAG: thymidylate synthase [Methylotenera sp.]|uniref:thymidylate synthase n=1 Tax=Methylotenera sp. TaxID=2051956 RepID=UPI000D4FF8B1|nr:thymidylate synthase [Methylotenera sp.]PPC84705.1 MAG: thymidylate synthase [Methylotenera sp.]